MEKNLTICQDCKEESAIYGDGLTWSRCAGCQYKAFKDEPEKKQESVTSKEGISHEIIPGLVSIVMPIYMLNYQLFHYTGNAIGSIREHTNQKDYELVIIDNGSPVQPPSPKSYYAQRVIKNEKNLGVTKAWNQGIRCSVGEYICLMNNDVQVFQGWLDDMKKTLIDGYDLVMAHPMYSLTEPFSRSVESWNIRNHRIAEAKLYSDFKDFSCVMFKRSLLEEIGMFDEIFFNYYSDSDLFRRMDEGGKKYICAEMVPTSHLSYATGYEMKKEATEIEAKDKATFKEKWENRGTIKPKNRNLTMRTDETGDAIYLIKEETYHHIKNPETLHALGFEFGDEITIEYKRLVDHKKRGKDLDMNNYQEYA